MHRPGASGRTALLAVADERVAHPLAASLASSGWNVHIFVGTVPDRPGTVDLVVVDPAPGPAGPLLELGGAGVAELLHLRIGGVLSVLRAVAPRMPSGARLIVMTGGEAGLPGGGDPDRHGGAVGDVALGRLANGLACELAGRAIAVDGVALDRRDPPAVIAAVLGLAEGEAHHTGRIVPPAAPWDPTAAGGPPGPMAVPPAAPWDPTAAGGPPGPMAVPPAAPWDPTAAGGPPGPMAVPPAAPWDPTAADGPTGPVTVPSRAPGDGGPRPAPGPRIGAVSPGTPAAGPAGAPPLAGRVAVVTGASRGIGAAVAARLASDGAAVVTTARTLDPSPGVPGSLVETVGRIRAAGGRATALRADLTRAEDRRDLVRRAEAAYGPVDILVNNAAVSFFVPLVDLTPGRWALMLEIQVLAALHLTELVAPGMRTRRGGTIVNITSRGARHVSGPPYRPPYDTWPGTAYGTCKAALEAVSVATAAELVGDGIAVTGLAPTGIVPTPGSQRHNDDSTTAQIGVEPVDWIARSVSWLSRSGVRYAGRVLYTVDLADDLGIPPGDRIRR